MSGLIPCRRSYQPLCNCCGAKIRKWTDNYYPHRDARLPDKAACQAKHNEKVVSVSYTYPEDWDDNEMRMKRTGEPRYVWRYSTWDGESYIDSLFCSGTCETMFARNLARPIRGDL